MIIPYGRQDITDADISAVNEVLRSDFLTQGPIVPRFEKLAMEKCGALHALAMNSATSALHAACLALGLGDGDWLWTTPITFVASSNCALYCGAKVDFVDIDPRTYNMSVAALEEKLRQAEKGGRLPKIVVPVHFTGQSCDMRAIQALSQRYGFRIIEDASHAVGGSYDGAPVGCGRYSDVTIFSFHPVKIITTGEGGMALTNDDALAARMNLLRSHGITRDPAEMEGEPEGPWYYQQIDLGFNFRMSDIQAALGVSQIQRLETYIARRHDIAARYDNVLKALPVVAPWRDPQAHSALHLYVIQVEAARHKAIFEGLRARGIGVQLHYIPVHTQPHYRRMGFKPGDFPEAERFYGRAISLPIYATLTDAQQDQVVSALAETLSA
jgi:UDP-4-amino-4,6-dideoxy-N-acetyl-beta-L-altrosamine transaminase